MSIVNINSEASCRKAYLNYHCYGNTMGISDKEMGQITQAWSGRISSWQASVSSDDTEYEFDDSDYAKYREQGKEAAKEATGGYSGNNGGSIAHSAGDAQFAVAGSVGSIVGKKVAQKSGTTVANKLGVKLSEEAAKKAGDKATVETGKQAGKAVGFIIGCTVGALTAAAYWIKNPNKKEKEACDALQTEMAGAQATLSDTQSEMAYMSDELIALSDEANSANEDANEEIEEQKTEYDMYQKSYLALQAKIEAGEPLTETEKELYQDVVEAMGKTGSLIEEISTDTTDNVSDMYDEMGTYQEGYDTAAETMGQIEGLTDYAESFDKSTQVMCYVEGAAQSLNAASSAKSAIEAFSFASSGAMLFGATAWAYVFAALGVAAAASSGVAAGQQFTWAGQVGNEIESRKNTQDLNTDTMDIYTEEVDNYSGMLQGVGDLELEIPDEVEAPEQSSTNGINSSEYTNYTEVIENEGDKDKTTSKVVTENSDGTGQVIVAKQYAAAICKALGLPATTSGTKFGENAIPQIIANLMPGFSVNDIRIVMNGGQLSTSYDASLIQTVTGDDTGKDTNINNSESSTQKLKTVIDFYAPIFRRAAQQGWKC